MDLYTGDYQHHPTFPEQCRSELARGLYSLFRKDRSLLEVHPVLQNTYERLVPYLNFESRAIQRLQQSKNKTYQDPHLLAKFIIERYRSIIDEVR